MDVFFTVSLRFFNSWNFFSIVYTIFSNSKKAEAFGGLAASTYVDKLVKITLSQVMENRSIVKISQVGHIFAFFVFGGVDLSNKVFLEVLGLFFSIIARSCVWFFLCFRVKI